MSCVKVWVPLIGPGGVAEIEWASPGTTADEFMPGVLTVTHVATGDVIQTFWPDKWIRATVYDDHLESLFSLRNAYLDPVTHRKSA